MTDTEVVKEYRSSILNFMLLPLIGAVVILMGILPFLITGGLDIGVGGYIYALITIALGVGLLIFPFTYKVILTKNSVIYQRFYGEKEIGFGDVAQVGQIEQRVMNGAPIAINKATLHKADGTTFELSLRNIGLEQGKEILSFIAQAANTQ